MRGQCIDCGRSLGEAEVRYGWTRCYRCTPPPGQESPGGSMNATSLEMESEGGKDLMARRLQISIPLPLPPGWLLGALVALTVVGAFMAIDRTEGHWYTPDEQRIDAVEDGVVDAARERAEANGEIARLRERVSALETGLGVPSSSNANLIQSMSCSQLSDEITHVLDDLTLQSLRQERVLRCEA